jgi:maleate isomerase
MTLARIGLMVPSSNTVMEPDFQRALHGQATVHTARMHLADPVTTDGERMMLEEHAGSAARDLGTLEPDLVVFGCTSAGSLLGRAGDEALRAQLSSQTGSPVIGILDAIGKSLRATRAVRVSVFTPYVEELTEIVAGGLTADGFEVTGASGLGIRDNAAIGRVDPRDVVRGAKAAFVPGSDAMAIACTNFRALEVRDELEQELEVPVVTSNSAALDAVRDAMGAGR